MGLGNTGLLIVGTWWINPAQAQTASTPAAAAPEDQPSSGSRWLIALVGVALIGGAFMYFRRRRT